MNTPDTHQVRTAIVSAVLAVIACASAAAPAFAAHMDGADDGGTGVTAVSPFAEPIAALEGMTLAQYVQKHQAGDPRTFTVM